MSTTGATDIDQHVFDLRPTTAIAALSRTDETRSRTGRKPRFFGSGDSLVAVGCFGDRAIHRFFRHDSQIILW